MSRLKVYLRWDDPFFKNDAIDLPCEINRDITGWKIRAKIYDKSGNFVDLATANVTDGSADQIEITDASNGKFTVKILENQTGCFDDKSFIEIEREDSSGKLRTIVKRDFPFIEDEID